MIRIGDVMETVSRCQAEVPDLTEFPAWCDRAGIELEAAEVLLSLAVRQLGGGDDLPDDLPDDPDDLSDADAESVGNLAAKLAVAVQVFVLGVELGRIPTVADADLPDLGNVTETEDGR